LTLPDAAPPARHVRAGHCFEENRNDTKKKNKEQEKQKPQEMPIRSEYTYL